MQIKLNGRLIDLSSAAVMGIINITPDSFFEGSRHASDAQVLRSAERILSEGGRIVDFGGYSSRPSAENVSAAEEIRRLSFALDAVLKEFSDIAVSIDTFRSEVVRHVVKNYQPVIINDISGGSDGQMFAAAAEFQLPYVLMHMRGTPADMQQHTQYGNITAEIISFLAGRLRLLYEQGVHDVIVDPGFGFAKTLEQNYTLLRELPCFSVLNVPVMAGISRKSMIYKLLETTPEGALNGTTAANMLALLGGASILRVHDVKEAVETIKIFEQYKFHYGIQHQV